MRPSTSLLWPLCVALAFSLSLAAALAHFGPGSASNPWTSDAAIPVLMANDPAVDPFRLFYWGQDRIGAWPWLAAARAGALLGFVWTPLRLFAGQAAFSLLTLPVLWALGRRSTGLLLAGAFAALALFHPLFQGQLFALSQPFGWQLVPLFLAWALSRAQAEALSEGRLATGAGLGLAAALPAVLACWTNPVSGPLLGVALLAEGLRLRGSLRPRRWPLLALPVAAGALAEVALRRAMHAFSLAHYGTAYRTPMRVDYGHVGENLLGLSRTLWATPASSLVLLGVGAGGWAAYRLARGRPEGRDARLLSTLAGLGGMAAANFGLMVLLLHVRLNQHAVRYLVPTVACGVLAAAVALARWAWPRSPLGDWLAAAVGPLVAASALLVLPRLPGDFSLAAAEATAQAVAPRPGMLLLGRYWDVYAVAAALPQLELHALPLQVEDGRTPWLLEELRRADEALLISRACRPPPRLDAHGVDLALVEPTPVARGAFAVFRYARLRPSDGKKME